MEVTNYIKERLNKLLDDVDKTFSHFQPLTTLAKRINLRPAHILLSFLIIALVTLGSGIFSHLFVAIFGMIYPSYMTFKALESSKSQKTKQWLTYWIVFGFFTAFARIVKYFLFFFVSLQSYNVIRVLFYLYLFYPKTNGAAYLYNKYLRSQLTEVENFLEEGNIRKEN